MDRKIFVLHKIRNIALALQHLFFPFRCPICYKPATYGCKRCIASSIISVPIFCVNCGLPHTEESNCKNYIPLLALSSYSDGIRKFIIKLKFHNYRPLGKLFGRFLAHRFCERIENLSPDYLTFIPNHKNSARTFSHTEDIAIGLGEKMGIPVSDCLEWKFSIAHQIGKTGAEREELASDSLQVTDEANIAGKKFILIDDVYTTGSTARAGIQALKNAGAECVAIIVVAKQIS